VDLLYFLIWTRERRPYAGRNRDVDTTRILAGQNNSRKVDFYHYHFYYHF
jgi:hypothetical protein